MIGRVVLHREDELDPIELTRKINLMNIARENLRKAHLDKTGHLLHTPIIDGAIDELERLLSLHLPGQP